jgi:hypothetical protein
VFVNGIWHGIHRDAEQLVARLRELKHMRGGDAMDGLDDQEQADLFESLSELGIVHDVSMNEVRLFLMLDAHTWCIYIYI